MTTDTTNKEVGALSDERDAFEASYVVSWNAALETNGWNGDYTVDDVKNLRNANDYGEGREYLNGCWDGWQAARRAPAEVQAETVLQWQPIETAPKTGRTLLLGYPNSLGNWRTTRGQWMSGDYIAEYWEEPDDVEPGWFETSVEADDVPNCWSVEPTHWMPLPAAPAASGGERS